MKPIAFLLCAVLILNPIVLATEGPGLPRIDGPSEMNGQSSHFAGAWTTFSKGFLTIHIPFLTPIQTWDQLAITLYGLQFILGIQNQNQVGWMVYCDLNGNVLWAGPITAFDNGQWHWIFTWLLTRGGTILPFQPLFTLITTRFLILNQLRQNIGNEMPAGFLRIIFDGAALEATDGPIGVEIESTTGGDSYRARLWTATKYQRFVNFIAFGLAGSLLVTQLLVITNLLNRPTNFELFLYTPEGILFTTLVFTIAALRSKTINLTQAIPAAIRTEADVLPEFFFGTGRIVSDQQAELDVATVYRITDNTASAEALSAGPAQNGAFLGEAGLAVPTPSTQNILAVFRSSEEDTGVAVGNPDPTETATVSMSLIDTTDTEVATATDISIPPLGVKSQFFWQYFLGTQIPPDFAGTLIISSNVGVQTTALNTLNGFIQSSLPSAQPGP